MVKAKNYFGLLLALMLPSALTAAGQQPPDQHHNHQQRVDGVNERGDHAMGFSHEKTTHHFRLTADGGAIEVTTNDPDDAASREQIKAHLSHIAKMFKDGDFSAPMFIHGEAPAGVPVMKRLKADITYTFEAIEFGGRVRIATANAEAVEAIHGFMLYQIKDHQTGDSLEVDKQVSTTTYYTCTGREATVSALVLGVRTLINIRGFVNSGYHLSPYICYYPASYGRAKPQSFSIT